MDPQDSPPEPEVLPLWERPPWAGPLGWSGSQQDPEALPRPEYSRKAGDAVTLAYRTKVAITAALVIPLLGFFLIFQSWTLGISFGIPALVFEELFLRLLWRPARVH
jgi:hypothetical protein